MQNSNRYIIFTTEQIPQTLKHRLTMNEQAHQYVEDFMAQLILRNPNEPEFHQAVREVAAQVLPHGYGYEFSGITREESETSSNTAIIFGICILLIYLILSALYESFLIPFAVILSVPCGPVSYNTSDAADEL